MMRKTSMLAVLAVLPLDVLLSVGVPAAQADVGIVIGIPLPGVTFYAPVPPPVYYPPPPAYYPPPYYYGPPRYYPPVYGSVYFGGGRGWGHHGHGRHWKGRHRGRHW